LSSSPSPARSGRLPTGVWIFGWISFVTDTASEAVYPLLPIFLTTVVGAGPFAIGLIEGVADATASILKLASGRLSDRLRRRKPIIVAGYTLASLVRPMVALVSSWPQVLAVRFVDRIGKGLRGAPRDALLADLAPPGERARVFGVQRAMDHAGAVAGPLLAAAFLWWRPGDYRTLFALTIVPGLFVIALLSRVPADARRRAGERGTIDRDAASTAWRHVPRRVYAVLGVILLFTLGNSTDAYLLLRLSDAGLPVAAVPLAWAALHAVKSVSAVAGGSAADRFGRRLALASGWVVYAGVYAGFAVIDSLWPLVACFLIYGIYFGLTEGAEKALLADLAPTPLRATVYGLHGACAGFGGLVASVLAGVLWEYVGPAAAFGLGAALALLAGLLIWPAARPDAARRQPA
jgi:MFS family permease